MVDIVMTKEERQQQINTLQSLAASKKHALQVSRIHLLDSKNKAKAINHHALSTTFTAREGASSAKSE